MQFPFVKRALALAGAFIWAMGLIGAAEPASAAGRLTIESGGISRTAVVVVRDRLKLRRRPLIIVLHRGGGLGARARRHLGLEETAQTNRPIFAYPDAIGGGWPIAAGPESERDIKYLHDLTDKLVGDGLVDQRRIFIVGVSSGGVFAYRVACAGGGRPVAGLATFIAAMPLDMASCAPVAPFAYVAVSNSLDPAVPYGGGKATLNDATLDVMGAEASLATFAKLNNCGARRDDKPFAEREARNGFGKQARGALLTYAGCKPPIELIRFDAASHRMPGRRLDREVDSWGEERKDFDASRAVWEFLRRNGA